MKTRPFTKSGEFLPSSIHIQDNFWNSRMEINRTSAIFYQWEQLEKTGSIDNFRIIAGEKQGYRQGFFYCDSDVHKWADAAAKIITISPDDTIKKELSSLLDSYIDLVKKTQRDDGYVYTYNQFHFPTQRWTNLQIEHELYTFGHLLEAAVSYAEYNQNIQPSKILLDLACRTADLICNAFMAGSPRKTPGHEEIEIALIKLFRITGRSRYLDLASHFIDIRGKDPLFGFRIIGQAISQAKRSKYISKDKANKGIAQDSNLGFNFSETMHEKEPLLLALRSGFQFLTGRYFQQNSPVRRMKKPFGHSVRWGYLVTAMAMLYQETGDHKLLSALEKSWSHLVQKRMYITGGIGSLPMVEGFGRDYELNNQFAYCETCAAIANIFLNWELTLITNDAKYAELLEWQLYNAASVGIALDGKSYLYRNPLESHGKLVRQPWFGTPCCPSNISRLWAGVGKYIYSQSENELWVHQYIGNSFEFHVGDKQEPISIEMTSELPWKGKITIKFRSAQIIPLKINMRIPGWSDHPKVEVDGTPIDVPSKKPAPFSTGGGFSPMDSKYLPLDIKLKGTVQIDLTFPMPIRVIEPHPRVKMNKNHVALTRGPLVYCFESTDNSEIDLLKSQIDSTRGLSEDFDSNLFGGITKLQGYTTRGSKIIAIPYFCWSNRGVSEMKVWFPKK